ncbi:phage major capsid protein [Streptomyces sp. NPDC006798]|uniref:phage major capsid protein n=1 Tax=unclassified Streptomyces TaxID=2593676 RepID=UPI0033EAABA1
MVDISRGSSGVALPLELSNEIWQKARQSSAVMQLARKIPLAGSGVSVPMITGDPVAQYVGETGTKPVSRSTLSNKTVTPYKIAVIQPFSNEFARDMEALYETIVERMPEAIATAFDKEVFHSTTVRTGMDRLSTANDLVLDGTNTYADLVAVDTAIASANGTLNGWVFSPKGRGVLLGASDSTGRPLFLNNLQTEGGIGSLLGSPVVLNTNVYKADAASDDGEVIGYAGDWSSAVYGTVEGIKLRTSTEATLTDGGGSINLFEQNMFAVLAEIEIGFAVKDINHFVKITSGVNSVT